MCGLALLLGYSRERSGWAEKDWSGAEVGRSVTQRPEANGLQHTKASVRVRVWLPIRAELLEELRAELLEELRAELRAVRSFLRSFVRCFAPSFNFFFFLQDVTKLNFFFFFFTRCPVILSPRG